jgi:hypothetical protein
MYKTLVCFVNCTMQSTDARVFDAKACDSRVFDAKESLIHALSTRSQEIYSKKVKNYLHMHYTCLCVKKRGMCRFHCVDLQEIVPIPVDCCSILQPGLLGVDNSLRIMLPTAKKGSALSRGFFWLQSQKCGSSGTHTAPPSLYTRRSRSSAEKIHL